MTFRKEAEKRQGTVSGSKTHGVQQADVKNVNKKGNGSRSTCWGFTRRGRVQAPDRSVRWRDVGCDRLLARVSLMI